VILRRPVTKHLAAVRPDAPLGLLQAPRHTIFVQTSPIAAGVRRVVDGGGLRPERMQQQLSRKTISAASEEVVEELGDSDQLNERQRSGENVAIRIN